MTDMRTFSKFEFECRIETNARNGWETAALRECFIPYIVQELEAVSSSGFSSDGM